MSTLPEAKAPRSGRRRAILFVCTLVLLNALAWVAYNHWASPRRDLVRIEYFAPGDDGTIGSRPEFRWKFNLDMAQRAGGKAPASITPAINGNWSWEDARTLVFRANEDLPPATEYSVALVTDQLRSVDGFQLQGQPKYSVHTATLQCFNATQVGRERDQYIIELQFSDLVSPRDVLAHLELAQPNGEPAKATLVGNDTPAKNIRIKTEAIPYTGDDSSERSLHVLITPGLQGQKGNLATTSAQQLTASISRSLHVTSQNAYAFNADQPSIMLSFNGPVAVGNLRNCIRVEPSVPFTMTSDWESIKLHGEFECGTRYRVIITPPADATDYSIVPAADEVSVLIPNRSKSVWFDQNKGYLSSSGNRAVVAHAVNVDKVEVVVRRIYENNARLAVAGDYGWDSGIMGGKEVARKAFTLKNVQNKAEDLRLSLDDLLGTAKAPDGLYQLNIEILNTKPDNDNYNYGYEYSYGNNDLVVCLSDIGLTAKQGPDGIVAWCTSLSTAKPIPNTVVTVYSSKHQLIGQGLADAQGLARIPIQLNDDEDEPELIIAEAPAQGEPFLPEPTREAAQLDTQNRLKWDGPVILGIATPRLAPPSPVQTHHQIAWLNLEGNGWNLSNAEVNGATYHRKGYEAFTYADRGVYRPGETVYLRSIVRDPNQHAPSPFPLHWQIRRPDGFLYQEQTAMLDADGGAAITLPLASDLPTGRWSVNVGVPDGKRLDDFGSVSFQVEEYMPDRIEVSNKIDPDHVASTKDNLTRHFLPTELKIAAIVQGDYLFGQPCVGLPVNFTASVTPVTFRSSQWKGWIFGDSADAAMGKQDAKSGSVDSRRDDRSLRNQTGQSMLDEKGSGRWEVSLRELVPDSVVRNGFPARDASPTAQPTDPNKSPASEIYRGPWALNVQASVSENGGRAVTGSSTTQLDMLPWYIALRPAAGKSPTGGEPTEFDVQLVRPDGTPADVSGSLKVTLLLEDIQNNLVERDNRYIFESTRDLQTINGQATDVAISGGKGHLSVTPPHGGSYVLCVEDAKLGAISSMSFMVGGDDPWSDNISRENPERLEVALLPANTQLESLDKNGVRPGDKLRAIVRSPFAGELLLTVETDQVLSVQVVHMSSSSMEIPLQVTEAWRPNAYVTATVIRPVELEKKWRTVRAYGVTRVAMNTGDRKITIAIDAPEKMQPKSSLPVTLHVTDPSGRPVAGAPITLYAVDEGILQLTNFKTPDPLAWFHEWRRLGVQSSDLYSLLMPEAPKPKSEDGGDASMDKEKTALNMDRHTTAVSGRRVESVAIILPEMRTDSQGMVKTSIPVGQFDGKLRLLAVSYKDRLFGSSDKNVQVRGDLIVQESLPRFAAPEDTFAATFTLFNNTDRDGIAMLNFSSAGASSLMIQSQAGLTLSEGGHAAQMSSIAIGAHGQITTTLQLSAPAIAGVSQIHITGKMGSTLVDKTLELPIRPAASMITRGGVVMATPGKPVEIPIDADMLIGTTSLSVNVTPRPMLNVPQGLDYLNHYPYGCCEQTTSTCFALIALPDIGPKIAPHLFEKKNINAKLQAGIWRLRSMQTADGGLAMWPGGRESWPWGSVYAAHFITEMQLAGYTVPSSFADSLMDYVHRQLAMENQSSSTLELQGYAAYVLALAGKPDRPAMSRLEEQSSPKLKFNIDTDDHATMSQQCRLYLTMAQVLSGRRDLAMTLLPQTTPLVRTGRDSGGNIGSPIRDQAIAIGAMLLVDRDNPAIPQLVQRLADAGRQGQWRSTQDTAFALLAIGRYLREQPASSQYDVARLLKDAQVLSQAADGGEINWSDKTPVPLALEIDGPANARGYATWVLNGVPLKPPADADHGLKVRRQYMDRNGKDLDISHLTAGTLVCVELSISGASGVENVVIDDLLPAGLEIENPRLETTFQGDNGDNNRSNDIRPNMLDMRDDRLVLVVEIPNSGKGAYHYLARAVTPGNYVIPPVHAECMYDTAMESTYGGGGTMNVTVPASITHEARAE